MDHRRNPGNVNTASRYFSRNQNRKRAVSEGREGSRALGLSEFTTEGRCTEAISGQLLSQVCRIDATVHEEQAALLAGKKKNVHEGRKRLMSTNAVANMLNIRVRFT